jgi:hypothetical protein
VTHPILSMLPDEVRALHFEAEVDRLDEHLSVEKQRAAIVRDMSILLDLEDVGRSVALRSTAKSKASSTSRSRIHREPQRTRR